MYFFLIEVSYLHFFSRYIFKQMYLQMKNHLVEMLNKDDIIIIIIIIIIVKSFV